MQERTYRIGEAAKLLNLKTYVLRFWETEFSQLHPHRTEKGQRLYSEQDVAMLRTIRHLLHERGLTIEGARKILAEQKNIVMPLDGGEDLPPEAAASEPAQPLYSEALTEAVISALQRTGQNGFGSAHDDDDELHLPDTQTIESIVARVIAAGEGVPPEDSAWLAPAPGSRQNSSDSPSSRVADSLKNAQGSLFPASRQDSGIVLDAPYGRNDHDGRTDRRTTIVPDVSSPSSSRHSPDFQEQPRNLHVLAENYGEAGMNQRSGPSDSTAMPGNFGGVAAVPAGGSNPALVAEIIDELESLRDMLSPRRFK